MENIKSVEPDKSFFKKVESKVIKVIAKTVYENEYCKYGSKDIAKTIFEKGRSPLFHLL